MQITKEMMNKLSKNDRQELKKKVDNLNLKELPLTFFCTYVRWFVVAFAFTLIILPLWKLAFPDAVWAIGYLSILICKFCTSLIFIGLIIDLGIIIMIYKLLSLDKIKREYFDIQPKIKTRKK
jgi:hypothetical protein